MSVFDCFKSIELESFKYLKIGEGSGGRSQLVMTSQNGGPLRKCDCWPPNGSPIANSFSAYIEIRVEWTRRISENRGGCHQRLHNLSRILGSIQKIPKISDWRPLMKRLEVFDCKIPEIKANNNNNKKTCKNPLVWTWLHEMITNLTCCITDQNNQIWFLIINSNHSCLMSFERWINQSNRTDWLIDHWLKWMDE